MAIKQFEILGFLRACFSGQYITETHVWHSETYAIAILADAAKPHWRSIPWLLNYLAFYCDFYCCQELILSFLLKLLLPTPTPSLSSGMKFRHIDLINLHDKDL